MCIIIPVKLFLKEKISKDSYITKYLFQFFRYLGVHLVFFPRITTIDKLIIFGKFISILTVVLACFPGFLVIILTSSFWYGLELGLRSQSNFPNFVAFGRTKEGFYFLDNTRLFAKEMVLL